MFTKAVYVSIFGLMTTLSASAHTATPPPRVDPLLMTCVNVYDTDGDTMYTRCENTEVLCYESQARSGAVCQFKTRRD